MQGVEKAFWGTRKVMTLDFHHFATGFFPGSGSILDVGDGKGKGYALNVCLKPGLCDINYLHIIARIIQLCVDSYDPECFVMQCGCDGLFGDPVFIPRIINESDDTFKR